MRSPYLCPGTAGLPGSAYWVVSFTLSRPLASSVRFPSYAMSGLPYLETRTVNGIAHDVKANVSSSFGL
jgi:hypothetical protein